MERPGGMKEQRQGEGARKELFAEGSALLNGRSGQEKAAEQSRRACYSADISIQFQPHDTNPFPLVSRVQKHYTFDCCPFCRESCTSGCAGSSEEFPVEDSGILRELGWTRGSNTWGLGGLKGALACPQNQIDGTAS